MADKAAIVEKLKCALHKRIGEMDDEVKATMISRDTATKSSAGDKHETARAMIQAEIDKAGGQLSKARRMLSDLDAIPLIGDTLIGLGSLVETVSDIYFIAVPFGKITVAGKVIFCISLASPIAQTLAGKKCGDIVTFMGRKIEIKFIS